MEKYIKKSALVAELEKLISNGKLKCQQSQENNNQESYVAWSEHVATCGKILSLIKTLEVKEVDLEKEIEEYAYSLPHGTTGSCFYVSDKRLPIARKFGIKHDWDYVAVENIAEHFFELGIKAQKGA
jgi:hypothetical protein